MYAKGTLFARLALASLGAVLAVALVAAPAQAGCEICDQYTLDIPEPQDNGGSSGGGDTPAPEDPAAPAPAPVAPVEPAPVAPVEPVTTDSGSESKPDRPKPKPEPEPVLVKTDGPPEAPVLPESTPLEYDSSESTPEAALAGLGSPGTVALIVVLFAAGAAIAIGRRRTSA